MKDSYLKLNNAPNAQPLSFDLEKGKLYLDKDKENPDSIISLDSANSVASMKSTVSASRPDWLKNFFGSMNDYVTQASKKAEIDTDTGALCLDAKATRSDLKAVCNSLAWLYEAQYRQNKEILLWIGEIILDYMARGSDDMTVEEAIESLGLLERNNGVSWSKKTLVKWPVVCQRIPHEIRQLPIPQTYLAEAALFSQPEDPNDRVKFRNMRDAMLVAVSEKPEAWSRARFVSCMKELQEHFGVTRVRNEGVGALQERLIAYYRLRYEAQNSGDPAAYFKNIGLDHKDVSTWIYNIEAELIGREKLEPDPKDRIPTGDGLTDSARQRVTKTKIHSSTP